ncbi:MAG: Ig-like domain-containing protein, partial [Pseudomonadota bacterium]|nr:Ig-like domain-containing protein [Pseudomonadota bacterium]
SDNITWSGTFTPSTNTEDSTNSLSLATSYTDVTGNNGPAATTANYEVETLAPTVDSFTLSDTALKIGDTATVQLVFSEAVIGFNSAADITVANLDNGASSGTLSTMTSSDNITWSGTFTPTTNTEDANNTLSLGTNYTDLAGNNGSAETTANYEVETLAPTVSSIAITSASGVQNSLLNAGDVVSVTATFSETVSVDTASGNPTITLVVGSNNRTATYASGSGSTDLVFRYTIQSTGTSGENDSNGISIGANALALNSGTIRDPAGNNGTLTHSAVSDNSGYKVDTTPPTVDSFTLSDTELKIGDTATVVLGFSEAVISFSNADITVPNLDNGAGSGTLSTMTSGDDITWAGTFTPATNTEDATNTLSLGTSYTDLAGNNGSAATTA